MKYTVLSIGLWSSFVVGMLGGQSLSVCEALNSGDRYLNTRVIVDGDLKRTSESASLTDKCEGSLKLGGKNWPWAIAINSSRSPYTFKIPNTLTLTISPTDHRSMKDIFSLSADQPQRVTIIGIFQTFPYARAMRGNRVEELGYGHLNSFPAQLIVEGITRVEPVSGRVR
jgi:hypothetical protein